MLRARHGLHDRRPNIILTFTVRDTQRSPGIRDLNLLARLAVHHAHGLFLAGGKWQSEPEPHAIYEQDLDKVAALRSLAKDGPTPRTLAQAALQFTLLHDAVTTVIPGAKNAGQVKVNVDAVRAPALSAEDRALIDRVTPSAGGRKIWPA